MSKVNNVLIIGGGTVGLATAQQILSNCDDVKITIYDLKPANVADSLYQLADKLPAKDYDRLTDKVNFMLGGEYLLNGFVFDIAFICVDTPAVYITPEKIGLNTTNVITAIKLADEICNTTVVRSTVPIGFCDLNHTHHLPEFLVQDAPLEEKSRIVFGMNKKATGYDAQ